MEENDNSNVSEDAPATAEACCHGPGFRFGVMMGALVGAVLATIFTPVSGEQARLRAAEKAPELWRRRDELAREGREKARQATEGARSRLAEAREAAKEATEEAQQEARRRYEGMTGQRSGPPVP